MGRQMKRISLTLLCLCMAAWTSGCCHSHYSRCGDWDDNCDCNQTPKRSRTRNCRGDRCQRGGRNNGCNDCCNDCNPCCGESGNFSPQSSPPMSYDGGAAMGGSCASGDCGSTSMSGSMPMYSGTPFPPGEGWTIQSTSSHPVGNEPFPAPGSSPTPITPTPARAQGWTNPSSAPNPAPVPPPVSYNR